MATSDGYSAKPGVKASCSSIHSVWCEQKITGVTVDAKLTPDRRGSLSGKHLLMLLGLGLIGMSLVLDRLLNQGVGFTTGMTFPLVISALLTTLAGFWVVPLLQQLKAGQIIREDGPQAHLKKAGTPTMGGVFIIPVGVATALIWSQFAPNVVAVSALTLSYAFIGWLDDWQILRRKSNKGISPKQKLALQIGFSLCFCVWLMGNQPSSITSIQFPLGWVLPLGILFWPLASFVLVAESNATNLTDGLDGLAAGTGAIALLGLAALCTAAHPELSIFCACLSGSFLGFLSHNRNPARVFMGDTGSLALGGALAATALVNQSLFGLLLLSGIFLVETLSVIAQVTYYKSTKDSNGIGRRLFKMAPLHHHLELTGWTEIQVVGWFYILGAGLAFVALLLLL